MTRRRIALAVSPSHLLRWHEQLRASLAARWPHAEVAFRHAPQGERRSPALAQLIALERLLLRRGKPTLCDRLDPPSAPARQECQNIQMGADVVVDLTGGLAPAGQCVLRPLYDGHPTEEAAAAAILSGDAPTLAVEDAATGRIVTEGLPSLEAADGLTGGLEAVYSRMAMLIEMALAHPHDSIGAPAAPAARKPPAPLGYLTRNLAFWCAREIYRLCCHSPHWRVGWRFTQGAGVLETGAITGAPWRPMRDRHMGFAADPFPVEWRGRLGVFYERLDYSTDIGEIWFQPFGQTGPVGDPVPALREPWHLSYPFLIEQDGELYMAPEASASGGVTLYRCVAFPDRWEPAARLLDGIEAADATIFRHGGRYWMTSVVSKGVGGYSDILVLHHAPTLFGPWEPHARNPVLVDARVARPAGAVVATAKGLFRPVQDCSRGYGRAMRIMRIDRLDPEDFSQSPVSHLRPGGVWPGARMHTLNRFGRLECIDGAIFSPKSLPLRRLTQEFIDRRLPLSGVEARECEAQVN